MSTLLKVAMYQQDICWNNPKANWEMVERAFDGLQTPVDLLVVPETFNTGFGDSMRDMAEPPMGATYEFAKRMAQRFDALFIGTWPVRTETGNGAVANRLHWVYPDGSYGYYDKAHTFRMSSEASQLVRGTQRKVFEWRGWRIKPAVCYDLRFPKWLRNSIRNTGNNVPLSIENVDNISLNYDLMVVCANWPASRHEAWTTLLRARAIENLSYVVGVNRVGTDGADIPYTGDSRAVDFRGLDVATCTPGNDTVAVAVLDKEALAAFRRHWPFYLDFDV